MTGITLAALLFLAGGDQAVAEASPEALASAAEVSAAVPETASPLAVPAATTPAQPAVDTAAPVPPAAADAPLDENAIVVTAREKVPQDPAQAINLATFEVVDAADRAVVGPVAMGYKHGLPEPLRDGLHNFLSNLTEPVVFVNFLLQGKPGKAFETVGRFALNTTLGGAGLFDMARRKPFHLPHRNNGFADTLGYYGVGPGPYFYLPLIGPSTARDLFGWVLDKSFLPAVAGVPFSKPAFALGTGAVKSLDDRVAFDDEIQAFRETGDSYTAEREYYLEMRRAEIEGLHGRKVEEPKAVPLEAPVAAPVSSPAPVPEPAPYTKSH